jgi:hypothetical protein
MEQRRSQLHDLRRRNVPIGAYDVNRQASVGSGTWALDGDVGYTYYNESTGLELSAVLGSTYNFMNPYTAYQSGIDLHLEVSASQYVTDSLSPGVPATSSSRSRRIAAPAQSSAPSWGKLSGSGRRLNTISSSAIGRRRSAPGATTNSPAKTGQQAGMPGWALRSRGAIRQEACEEPLGPKPRSRIAWLTAPLLLCYLSRPERIMP